MATSVRHQRMTETVHRLVADNYPRVTPKATDTDSSLSIELAGYSEPAYDALIYLAGAFQLGRPQRVGMSDIIRAQDGEGFVLWMRQEEE